MVSNCTINSWYVNSSWHILVFTTLSACIFETHFYSVWIVKCTSLTLPWKWPSKRQPEQPSCDVPNIGSLKKPVEPYLRSRQWPGMLILALTLGCPAAAAWGMEVLCGEDSGQQVTVLLHLLLLRIPVSPHYSSLQLRAAATESSLCPQAADSSSFSLSCLSCSRISCTMSLEIVKEKWDS